MTTHPIVIQISKRGRDALVVYHPNDDSADKLAAALGTTVSDQRGAYVYPVNRIKRALFKALRGWFGGKGIVADWTRRWRGPWAVVLPGEFVRLPGDFLTHDAAVQAEVVWILQHKV